MISSGVGGNRDTEINQPPSDAISDVSFSPVADFLAASSWDGQTRIWEVKPNGTSMPKTAIVHDAPALCCTWSKDGTKVFSAGVDKNVKILDVNTGQTMSFAAHDAPIKCCNWMEGNFPSLITGSWDKTLKYWDLRSPQPLAVVNLQERCYAMDVSYPLLVVATAERKFHIINLSSPGQIFKTVQSPLKYQTRCVSCFIDQKGFACGSIEGRVGIQYIDDKAASNNFSFKCHRVDNKIYPVNAISFHPLYGTFSTAGSDGSFSFWDKDSKQRLKSQPSIHTPITCSAFNRNGSLFAYGVSYDWSQGHEMNQPNSKCTIMLQSVQDAEVKPKQKK